MNHVRPVCVVPVIVAGEKSAQCVRCQHVWTPPGAEAPGARIPDSCPSCGYGNALDRIDRIHEERPRRPRQVRPEVALAVAHAMKRRRRLDALEQERDRLETELAEARRARRANLLEGAGILLLVAALFAAAAFSGLLE